MGACEAGDSRPVVLVVDDLPDNLTVLGELLQSHYRVRVANSGPVALRLAASAPQPDLILLDVMMPGMDGLEVLRRLQAEPLTRAIPVLFVTAMDDTADEAHGLALGALDYITKPLRPAIVMARVRKLELKRARDLLSDQNASLEAEVRAAWPRTSASSISIHALARLAETRDPETGNHLLRTQGYVRCWPSILRASRSMPPSSTSRPSSASPSRPRCTTSARWGFPTTLLKPGKLTPAEWQLMKTHAALGAQAIERAEQDLMDEGGPPIDFLACAKQIARHHHERWDGSGYPGWPARRFRWRRG
jgi:putative two-component system response regulator